MLARPCPRDINKLREILSQPPYDKDKPHLRSGKRYTNILIRAKALQGARVSAPEHFGNAFKHLLFILIDAAVVGSWLALQTALAVSRPIAENTVY